MLTYSIIITIALFVVLLLLGVLACRGGYVSKLLVKIGMKEQEAKTNWTAFSWNNMLEKLDYQADIIFFGDSIIRGSDFQKNFPDKKIVNLGCSGDTLSGMIERLSMIKALAPKKIFFLGGINGLTNSNVEQSLITYQRLLDKMIETEPSAEIYICSLLPLSPEKEKSICKNETIMSFNQKISKLAKEKGIVYIDIYSLYEKNGSLNPDLTVDGIHLRADAYERWAKTLTEYIA